ncbi:MAG: ribonuclease HII [Candidatus Liptonbacteria bacterium]|nr:ribonuclease HII [Candidatus Liptonbacteria bacterium]
MRASFKSLSTRYKFSNQRYGARYSVGIDEVGRGALAGPVTVAVACIPDDLRIENQGWGNLKDSKKLSPAQRKKWFAYFRNQPALCYSIARVYPRGVERLNISNAANRAATKACNRLLRKREIKKFRIFLDGGLYLEDKSEKVRILMRKGAKNFRKDSRVNSRHFASTIIKGDEKITAIAIASIIAKVDRDGYMERLSKKHPRYGFEIHKGYGTKKHFSAIRRYGPSKAHRLTFLLDFLENRKRKRDDFSRKS